MKNTLHYYPIAICLRDKYALVAGGGEVAERKVRSLLSAGAQVSVVAPDLTLGLRRLTKAGKIRWVQRKALPSDIRKAIIVIAATSRHDANKKISGWAKKVGALVNVVDKPALSDFISPAILHTRKATIAVYTNGRDPVLSRDLKNFLEEHWDVFLSYRDRL